MPRPARRTPSERAPGWPDAPTEDVAAEAARQFAINLRAAIGSRSVRSAALQSGVPRENLQRILLGRSWVDAETIARLEAGFGVDLWPGRPDAET